MERQLFVRQPFVTYGVTCLCGLQYADYYIGNRSAIKAFRCVNPDCVRLLDWNQRVLADDKLFRKHAL